MKKDLNVLITGGAGFIGSHVVEYFAETYPEYQILVMDSITYAADEEFFKNLESRYINVVTIRQDIRDAKSCLWAIKDFKIDAIIHLAAESHVDNSIESPNIFVETNVMGTLNLLNAAKEVWKKPTVDNIFYHISTDEVYGHLGLDDPAFTEETPYDPRSPYSASKASSDHMVRAFGATHGLPIVISNCSNNYGERQHREKLLPKTIINLLTGKKIPVYGKGENIRDWLYVKDHVKAIDTIFHLYAEDNKIGATYNIGGDSEVRNIDIVKKLIHIHMEETEEFPFVSPSGAEKLYEKHIEYVTDRKGHDFRYAINHDKLTHETGWKPSVELREGLKITYNYYKNLLK